MNNCIICDSTETFFLYRIWSGEEESNREHDRGQRINAGDIYKCNNCKGTFKDLSSLPFNPEEYYSDLDDTYYDSLQEDRRTREHNKMKSIIHRTTRSGRILDIGCGTGGFLDSLDNLQWEKWGVEPALYTGKILTDKNIKPINTTFLDAIEIPEDYFDVVTMFDVIEHVTNPGEHLKKIRRILRNNGILLIATPNIHSLMARLSGKYWRHYNAIVHVAFYSPKILSDLLKKENFRELYVSKYDYNLSFIKTHKHLFIKTSMFVIKALLLGCSAITRRLFRFDVLKKLPSINKVQVLPWYYDFFCVRAQIRK